MSVEPDIYLHATLVGGLPTVTFPPRSYHRRVTNIVVGNGVTSSVTVYRGQLGSTPVAQNTNGQNNTLSGSISLPAGQQLFVQWSAADNPVSNAFARASFERSDTPLDSTPDTQAWSTNIVTELVVGDAATGEIVIEQGMPAALAAYYSGLTISAVTIRLMPADGSYFYMLAGSDPVTGNDFAAMGNVKPGALVAADVAQQWFSFFNSSTGITQINFGDNTHDQRFLMQSNFTQFGGNGLRGDIDMYGIHQLLGGKDLRIFSAGPSAQPTVIIAHDGEIFFGGGVNPTDTVIGRVGVALLASDPIAALNIARTGGEVWNALALNAPWTNRGAGFAPLSYKKVASPDNAVWLVGELTVNGAVSGSVIATLPVNYRPINVSSGSAGNDGGGAGNVDLQVDTGGNIRAFGGLNPHIQINQLIPLNL